MQIAQSNLISLGLIGFISLTTPVFANDPWQDKYWRGPHFYESPKPLKKKNLKRVKPIQQQDFPKPDTPTQRMEREKANIESILNKAILDPTLENVYAWRMKEKETIARAERFAFMAKHVTMMFPETRLLKVDPADVAALNIENKRLDDAKEASIRQLAKTHGLLFFFSTRCAHCRSFAKVVKVFAEKYHFSVIPLSMEGQGIPEFPNAQNGLPMAKLIQQQKQIQNAQSEFDVPVLYAMDPNSKRAQLFPVSQGNMSLDSLTDSIFFVTRMMAQGAPV